MAVTQNKRRQVAYNSYKYADIVTFSLAVIISSCYCHCRMEECTNTAGVGASGPGTAARQGNNNENSCKQAKSPLASCTSVHLVRLSIHSVVER